MKWGVIELKMLSVSYLVEMYNALSVFVRIVLKSRRGEEQEKQEEEEEAFLTCRAHISGQISPA